MTITAPGLGAPGLASLGFGYQQGISPGFPAPIGAEQLFGVGQHQGYQPSSWPQAPHGGQDMYGRSAAGQVMPQQVQQVVSQLTGQILPVAEQIVLPRVIALAVQLVQQQVQQLMTQAAVPLITGQHPALAPQSQQPSWGQQPSSGQQPFWGQQPSAFGQTVPPYAGLS